MPELPEVETIAQRLKEILPGKVISQVKIFKPKSFDGEVESLLQQPIVDLSRRAKIIRLHFPHQLNILTHLKMTGQLIYLDRHQRVGGGHPTADWTQNLPSKHTRIQYDFVDGGKLFFNDQRLFGWMRVRTDQQVSAEFAAFGPDINDPGLTVAYLYPKLQKRSQALKLVIMDNSVMAGLGNIYACDTLNLARLSPFRPAHSLTYDETVSLVEAAQSIIKTGIELKGTTFDGMYVNVDGFAGNYQEVVRVYDRQGQPCPNCGAPIVKQRQGGRSTYYCEVCQK